MFLRFGFFMGIVFATTHAISAFAAEGAHKNAVLVRVNNRTITLEEFNKRYEQNAQLVPGKQPPKTEVLNNIINFELATQEARRLGLHKDPALKEQFDILLYQALVRRNIRPKIDALEGRGPVGPGQTHLIELKQRIHCLGS